MNKFETLRNLFDEVSVYVALSNKQPELISNLILSGMSRAVSVCMTHIQQSLGNALEGWYE